MYIYIYAYIVHVYDILVIIVIDDVAFGNTRAHTPNNLNKFHTLLAWFLESFWNGTVTGLTGAPPVPIYDGHWTHWVIDDGSSTSPRIKARYNRPRPSSSRDFSSFCSARPGDQSHGISWLPC